MVEIQQTFYDPPTVALASKWRAGAPDDFQFCIKAWQLITHAASSPTYRRLKSALSPMKRDEVGSFRPTEQVWLAWERTQEIARALRASVIVFQCPASFSPVRENVGNFRKFFERVEAGEFRLAWEPRGEWPRELVRELCERFGLIHCVDPFQSEPPDRGPVYWRLHGRGGYSYRYTDEDLTQLAEMLRRSDACGPAYVLFNNIWMKDDALRFQARC